MQYNLKEPLNNIHIQLIIYMNTLPINITLYHEKTNHSAKRVFIPRKINIVFQDCCYLENSYSDPHIGYGTIRI